MISRTLRKAAAAFARYRRQAHDPHCSPENRSLERQLEKARCAWLRELSEFRNEVGVVRLPADPQLQAQHLENCRVLPDRQALLARMKPGGVVAEVGVETGRFSRMILETCQPTALHLIDIDLARFDIGRRFTAEIEAGTVHLHQGDSSPIVRRFPDEHFDFIYIDGDHTYYGARRDIEAARAKTRSDGFLIFNDYTYWSPAESRRYGVVRAVNELCIEDDWEVAYFALGPFMYCDVALRRRGSNTAGARA
jgi:predicted O-methyltransferase YrrM